MLFQGPSPSGFNQTKGSGPEGLLPFVLCRALSFSVPNGPVEPPRELVHKLDAKP